MIRTQIQLTDMQATLIKQAAAERHVSMAEVIRQVVDHFLRQCVAVKSSERVERAIAVAGRFHSGSSDGSVRHDDHLAEAFRT